MAWYRRCKEMVPLFISFGCIIGGTLLVIWVDGWVNQKEKNPSTLSVDFYHVTSPAFRTHKSFKSRTAVYTILGVTLSPKTLRKRKKRIKLGKRTGFTTELEITTLPMAKQIHSTGKQSNSAAATRNPLQSKAQPKCNFSDTHTFKDCYVVRSDNKTWHDSDKQCNKLGMQLAVVDSPEELNFVKKFLSSKEPAKDNKDRVLQIMNKRWNTRRLNPLELLAEKTWVNLVGSNGVPVGRNKKERDEFYKQKGVIGGIAKTWLNVFGELDYELSQAYWVNDVTVETPTKHLGRMERKGNGCMSLNAMGYNRTDCQHKLPFICEYNK